MKLHLASCEDYIRYSTAKLGGANSFLMSYYYCFYKKTKLTEVLKILRNHENENWIIDSGLFTMMFGAGSNKDYTEEELLQYTNTYINVMKKIKYKGMIVEMEVHKILGMKALRKFRSVFEKKYDINKVIFVYHIEEKIEGFKKLAQKYPYIAISIPELRKVVTHTSVKRYIIQLCRLARSINPQIKIHLLGNTQFSFLTNNLYDSCDSTSWIADACYDQISLFKFDKFGMKKVSKSIKQDRVSNVEEIFESIAKRNKHRIKKGYYTIIKSKRYTQLYTIGAHNYCKLQSHINKKYFKQVGY